MDSTFRPARTRSQSTRSPVLGDQLQESRQIKNQNIDVDIDRAQGDLLHHLPGWLEEFTENLVTRQGSSNKGHTRKLFSRIRSRISEKSGLGQSTVFILTSRKTKIAKCARRPTLQELSCRRRTGNAIPRAESFGDLITADHKVLSDAFESRNNHRYAVVQDLATQWIQSRPCKTKNSQDTEKSLRKFLEPSQKPKIIYTDSSLEFGNACEEFSWNHCTATPHRSETNCIADRAVRIIKEGTSAVLLQSGLGRKMVGRFHGVLLLPAKF